MDIKSFSCMKIHKQMGFLILVIFEWWLIIRYLVKILIICNSNIKEYSC